MSDDIKKNLKSSSSKEDFLIFLKVYIIPILGFLVFIALVFLLIIPQINKILNGLTEIEDQNIEIDKYTNLLDATKKNFADASIQPKLEEIEIIAPTGTVEVVEFRNKLLQETKKYGISTISQTLSEVLTQDSKVTSENEVSIFEVPTKLEITGSYSSILEFINSLEKLEDFIVFNEFQFNKTANNNLWTLNITISKYQFSEDTEEQMKKYLSLSPKKKISEIVNEYLKERLKSD